MASQSWDGKRLYFTSSLLSNWDKLGDDNEQFLKAYDWEAKQLNLRCRFQSSQVGTPAHHALWLSQPL